MKRGVDIDEQIWQGWTALGRNYEQNFLWQIMMLWHTEIENELKYMK